MEFTYYMTQRPPMPGAQPKQGLIEIEDLDPYDADRGFRAYARLLNKQREQIIDGDHDQHQWKVFEFPPAIKDKTRKQQKSDPPLSTQKIIAQKENGQEKEDEAD